MRFFGAIVALVAGTLIAGAAPAPPAPPVPQQWIWSSPEARDDQTVHFRKTFTLDLPQGTEHPKGGWLIITADEEMTVFVNGEEILTNEAWQEVRRAEVGPFLRRGRNVLAVRVHNKTGAAGLVAKLVLTMPDDKKTDLLSDKTWLASETAAEGWNRPDFDDADWKPAHPLGPLGIAPWGDVIAGQPGVAPGGGAMPAERLKLLPGFQAERLYSVPKEKQGSWVNLCFDPKGRIIVSDQNGLLYRVTLDRPEPGSVRIEPIEVRTPGSPEPIGKAQGLCYAHDSLYVVVNAHPDVRNGLYRLRDTDGDDQFDEARMLRRLEGSGEHGPHAVRLGPDGKSLYVMAGNHTKLPEVAVSRVPLQWGEDQLLPRIWDPGGHAVDVLAPGGYVCRTDADGEEWELVAAGLRNSFDFDFTPGPNGGEMFTYDADMEWDVGLPWYRPTRICHLVSGADFGWRSGSGKWPAHYADSLPPVVDIGQGSPSGVTFGTGAKFPAKYQRALFALDWTYGVIYAVHLTPRGGSFTGTAEKFLSGRPLPVTDAAVGPDGALYFTTGGRGTQSGLYRVTYQGDESTGPAAVDEDPPRGRVFAARRKLESFHGRQNPAAVEAAWQFLDVSSPFLRHAARVAVEHQPPQQWQKRALAGDPEAPTRTITALIALARSGDKALQPRLINALGRPDWAELDDVQRLALLRAYALCFTRMGQPTPDVVSAAVARLDPLFPTGVYDQDRELAALLVYLGAPSAVAKTMGLLQQASDTKEQIAYAYALRSAKTGWTPPLRRAFFEWFNAAQRLKGGNSFLGYLKAMKADAVANLNEQEKAELADVLNAKPAQQTAAATPATQRDFVKRWTVAELVPLADAGLKGRQFDRGKALHTELCASCHRFGGEGGSMGPDLTGVGARFNTRDLLDSIVEPSKVISDQYQSEMIQLKGGKVLTGRIAGERGGRLQVVTGPNQSQEIDPASIARKRISKLSMMPTGLLDTLDEGQVLDLLAYLLSGGDPDHAAYK